MNGRALDWLVLGLAVFLLTAGRSAWLSLDAPWWSVFALWAALIGLGALASRHRGADDG